MDVAELSPRLAAALQRREGRSGQVQALERLTGGATKATWSFDWISDQRHEALILQQTSGPPARAGEPPRLSAEQDAAVMQLAVATAVAAPRVKWVLLPDDDLGSGYVTARVDGETLGKRLVHDAAYAEARHRLAAQCGAALAAIHRLPIDSLPFLARLSPADELALYGAQIEQLGGRHPALAFALRWIGDHLPERWTPAFVHADFRTGNLIVGPEGLRCVLDWEIARIGDPMQDLGVLCMRTWRFGGVLPVGGFGRRADLYAAYEAAGGARVDPERVRFWEAFSNLKWAIACARRGTARRDDGHPASVELCAVGRRLEEPLWDFFELIGEHRLG